MKLEPKEGEQPALKRLGRSLNSIDLLRRRLGRR